MEATDEGKGDRLLIIQEKIANLDFSQPGVWKEKARLDQELVNIMSEQMAYSTGNNYDKSRLAVKQLKALNELMRSKARAEGEKAVYYPMPKQFKGQ